jgi:2'-5' RNA ligase
VKPEPIESALVIRVPEAEALVGGWRRRLDPSAAWGVPAHVTILYPFVAPAAIDAELRSRVAALLAGAAPFAFTLAAVRTFGDDVLYLAPEPAEPFRRLTDLLVDAFPEHPPYGGGFDEIVPHLTVAEGVSRAEMRAARAAVERGLPVACRAVEVTLMAGAQVPRSWQAVARFTLGGPAGKARASG